MMTYVTYYGWYARTSKTRWFFAIFVVLFFYHIFHAFFSGIAFVVDSILYSGVLIANDFYSEGVQGYHGEDPEEFRYRQDPGIPHSDHLISLFECLSKIRSRSGDDVLYIRLHIFVEMISIAPIPCTRAD